MLRAISATCKYFDMHAFDFVFPPQSPARLPFLSLTVLKDDPLDRSGEAGGIEVAGGEGFRPHVE